MQRTADTRIGISPKATIEAETFYQNYFGSFRGGAIYVLEALPQLLYGTWKELTEGARGFDLDAFESVRSGSTDSVRQMDLSFTGSSLKTYMDTSQLSAFDRVTADYFLYLDPFLRTNFRLVQTHGFQYPVMGRRTDLKISKNAAIVVGGFGFSEEKRLLSGASYVLSAFHGWWKSVVESHDVKKHAELAADLLRYDALTDPLLAGAVLHHRLPITTSKKLALFSLASLEITTMSPQKKIKKVQASPRLSPVVGERFRELFATMNAGFDFALSSFPRLYEQTFAQEIAPIFTQQDYDDLMGLAQAHNARLAQADMAGDTILWLARQGDGLEVLVTKIARLSPFGRVCLEVFLAHRKKLAPDRNFAENPIVQGGEDVKQQS